MDLPLTSGKITVSWNIDQVIIVSHDADSTLTSKGLVGFVHQSKIKSQSSFASKKNLITI